MATLTWDPSSTPTSGSDGSGTWINASNTNWTNGSADVLWNNTTPQPAYFGVGGTGSQTVTLGSVIDASTLIFNPGASYTLTSQSISLGSAGNGGSIAVNKAASINSDLYADNGNIAVNVTQATGNDLTISGALHGSYGFIKTGPGAMSLSNNNDFTGNIVVNGGTLIATEGQNPSLDGSLGSGNVAGRTITVNSGATLLLTDGTDANGSYIFGKGASGGVVNFNGTYTPDPNMPAITINGGTLSSTRYNPVGNITLNGGTLTQASADFANYPGTLNFYEGYQFIGTVTVGGNSPSVISATPNAVNGTIAGNHLGSDTVFNVAGTGSTVDLAVSSRLIDQSDDFDVYNNSTDDTYIGFAPGKLTKTGAGTMSLSAGNTYTGGTIVSGGKLIFAAPGALPVDSALTIGANTQAVAAVHGTGARNTLFVSSLSIAGSTNAWAGKLDLGDNDLDVQNGDLATITNQLKQGFNGNWNGSAGIVSSAAGSSTAHLTALGTIQNSTNGTATGTAIYSSFDGQPASNTDVLVKYTYYGDTNLNGSVDGTDYSRVDNGYLHGLSGWFNGDFNYDGSVNGSDYTLIDNAFNMQGTVISEEVAASTSEIAGTSAVPEPGMLGLISVGLVGMLGRRRSAKCVS